MVVNETATLRVMFDRRHEATKERDALVYIVITFKRERRYVNTGIRLTADQWGSDGRVKRHPRAAMLNEKIMNMMSNLYEFLHELEKERVDFSFERLDKYLEKLRNEDKPESPTSFLDYMKEGIEKRKIAETTRRRYWSVYKHLVAFGKIKRFDDLTIQNVRKWDQYAKSRCEKQSGVYNYHKALKVFSREAFADQLIQIDPYLSFRLDRGKQAERRYLTREELEKLESTEIPNRSLARVRDMFLFCCYTGLSYSDLCAFDFGKQAHYENGMYRIRGHRKKTGTEYVISLIDKAMMILRKYNYWLPSITNEKYNVYLKVVGAYCGIEKSLTSHMARHTFATTVTLANGVRIEAVSKMLGHTDIKTTQIYAKICDNEIDNEFNRLNKIV